MKAQEEFPENKNFRDITIKYKKWLTSFLKKILDSLGVKNSEELSTFLIIVIDGLTVKANLRMLNPNDSLFAWNSILAMIKASAPK